MITSYLDLMASGFPVERAVRVVRHEVGHWIVGQYHGFKSGPIEITMLRGDGHRGSAQIETDCDLRSVELLDSYLRRRISTLFAGALAESLGEDGKVNNQYAARELEIGGAQNDHKGIRELLRVLRGMTFGAPPSDETKANKQLQTLSDDIWKDTAEIIETNHELIGELTRTIMERAEKVDKKFGYRAPTFRKIPALAAWIESLPKH
ncbi:MULTISPECIES: hypothetical protein [Rhizobium/Agrobacterium group]|uniref:Peptidase M41 domain-containing protein n=1 Tax=Agrobacterium genomosp. 2 str. CFBP 5494 TaxID=1183436 RepID=A0A9W5AXL1_9HYPH|nr:MULTISPECIES: hypothetical protein [Rhizobium/Agrobacterium group]CAD7043458.1 hypothetical protein RP007_01025 [Rhizobium sp. P007]CUW85620.1 hypothetical protein AGR2A_Cc100207 [Agrobacterium genomosp. 2 str. CFBP 5494]